MHKDTYERTVTGSLASALRQRTSEKGDTAMVANSVAYKKLEM